MIKNLWKLREKDFKKSLDFIQEYGFVYNEKEIAYENKYNQQIKLDYYHLDPNLWVPIIYLINPSATNKREALDVLNEFKLVSKKIFKSEMYKLAYIIKNQIEKTKSIYGLILNDNH